MTRRDHRDSTLAGSEGHPGRYWVPRRYWASRLAPYAGEWAGWVVMLPVGLASHWWLGSSSVLPFITSGLTVLGVILAGVSWLAGRARGQITRVHATVTVGLGALWLIVATVSGPTTGPLLLIWAFGGATVCLSWNIRRALAGATSGGGGELFEAVKLAGVRATTVGVAPNKVTAGLQLPPGEITVTEVQKASDRLTGALRLHQGAVRISPHPEDLSQARMTVVPIDVLRHPQPWPGPSAPGGSITAPLAVGLYEDNEPQLLYLPGDKATARNATHLQVVGISGSGKSHGAKIAWTETLTRRDAVLIVLDPVKGEQTVGFLGAGNAHVITGITHCQEFMTRVPAAITGRTSDLGRWGHDQWLPESYTAHGMPYVVLWIEEATRVLEDAETLTRIAEAARSAGISLVLSLQKASFRRMNTDIRSQMGGTWCFGVNEISDAAFSLSEDVIAAGARPDQWKNRRPGANYLEAPGIPDERHPIPARTFDALERQLLEAIHDTTTIRPALDPTTMTTLGLPARPATTRVPATATPTAPPQPPPAGTEDPDGLDGLAPLSDTDDQNPIPLPEDHEPDLPAGPDDEIPDPDPDMALPHGRPTRAEARRVLAHRLAELAARGCAEFTIRDLPDPETAFGRSRAWLSGELSRLADEGALTRVRDDDRATVYRPHHTVTHSNNLLRA